MESAKISRQYFSERQFSSIKFSLPVEVIPFVRFFVLKYLLVRLVEMLYYKFYLSDKLYESAHIFVLLFVTLSLTVNCEDTNTNGVSSSEDCRLTPAWHWLTYPGCVPKSIPSFSCNGRCSSYLQVSGSKLWQMERSCMCCQESGEREASVLLYCPKAKQGERKYKKVTTKAPLECMCRPCTSVEESSVVPQEMVSFPDEQPINGHFLKPE